MALNYQRKAILLGVSGSGKSSMGNSLIGRYPFRAAVGYNPGTLECQREENRQIIVTDTPGFFDTRHFIAETSLKVRSALIECPNPHAFLIVFRGDARFTHESLRTIDILRILFGDVCFSHAICVFTRVEETTSDIEFQTLCTENESLRNFIQSCGGRVARIDNRSTERSLRAGQIIQLIDNLSNNGNNTFDGSPDNFIDTVLQKQQASNEQLRNRNPNNHPSQIEVINKEVHDIINALLGRYSDSYDEGSFPHWAPRLLELICIAVGIILGVTLIVRGNVKMGITIIVVGVGAKLLSDVRSKIIRKIKETLKSFGIFMESLRFDVRLNARMIPLS